MIKIILSLFFLKLPTWFEVYRDRKGDAHPNSDWKLRGITCLLVGATASIIINHLTWGSFACYTIASVCFFTGIFPYWINYVHLRNGVTHLKYKSNTHTLIPFSLATKKEVFDHVVNHLSTKAWPDKEPFWINLGWKNRLYINIGIVVVGYIFFILGAW